MPDIDVYLLKEIPDTSFLGSGVTVALVLYERLTSFPKVTKERSRESFLGFS